jgi:hypothetical protein
MVMIHSPGNDLINSWIHVRANPEKIRGPTNNMIHDEFATWIRDNIHYENWTWIMGNDFYFKEETDATLFKLMWV